MRVQLLTSIKARISQGEGEERQLLSKTWPRDKIFDDANESIPEPILELVNLKDPSVMVLGDLGSNSPNAENDRLKAELAQALKIIDDLEKKLEADVEAKPKEFPCPVSGCDKVLRTQQGLNSHLTQMHPDFKWDGPEGD